MQLDKGPVEVVTVVPVLAQASQWEGKFITNRDGTVWVVVGGTRHRLQLSLVGDEDLAQFPEGDAYVILGADRSWPMTRIRARYRELVTENHPDRATARGLPQDFIAIATNRMAAINSAYERIERERRPVGPALDRSDDGST